MPVIPPNYSGMQNLTEVVASPIVLSVPTADWGAMRWDDWPLIIPFDAGRTGERISGSAACTGSRPAAS